MAIFSNLGKYRNTGLLVMRIGLGIMFMFHGYPKLLGGPAMWTTVGGAMKHIGIDFYPVGWGLLAGVTETFGGFLILLGLAFRPAALLLSIAMMVAANMHLKTGDGLNVASHAIEAAVVFLGLTFVGPGKYSVDKK
ncbi:DoxX family protein [Flavihumibacter sp. R14]|nr:DoxX family protein [Flavihumibacter soli]